MTSRACHSCGTVIPASSTRCTDCQRAVWRAEASREARGYTRRWRTISTRIRKARPLCEIKLPGCTLIATAADHVTPLAEGGKSVWSNARPCCGPCNNRRRHLPEGENR